MSYSPRTGVWIIMNEAGRFWDGLHWQDEYPDATKYSGHPELEALPPDGAIAVCSYGENIERRYLTARSACPECGSTGPHEDNGGAPGGPHVTYLCTACGEQFDGEVSP